MGRAEAIDKLDPTKAMTGRGDGRRSTWEQWANNRRIVVTNDRFLFDSRECQDACVLCNVHVNNVHVAALAN